MEKLIIALDFIKKYGSIGLFILCVVVYFAFIRPADLEIQRSIKTLETSISSKFDTVNNNINDLKKNDFVHTELYSPSRNN
ncbi:hypothetical protein AGMMS50267_10780 [Spirochaetia bacterium]|nr:hypothetical protein AGMMS50267_10780 [Spirochaetia bacterium]